ncbi:DUF1992 domain-containing protein [Propioniciclava soli]|uniref:DUF1992 domain-containing protein n=1 Tax=Propioniciclava soli TaxID=2775081 RepID=A0ABZ3C7L8_9ACTN|nr:DUF1992 domain-containing protein [Propioniciclava soli]
MSGPSGFESWIDRQIREAMERGAFDHLPGAGKPLHLDDDPDWWVKNKMRAENLEPVLTGPAALRREVADIQSALADARTEVEARERCEDLNGRIRAYYAAPQRGRQLVVRLVDVDAEVARWRQRRSG